LREFFEGDEQEVVQTSTYVRKASERSSTADYLGEEKGRRAERGGERVCRGWDRGGVKVVGQNIWELLTC
jgi:hypothetical protein